MAVQAPPKTGFEKWQDGINRAVGDAKWNAWDCEIQMAVNKAMVWVETGASNSEWNSKPMRIGVSGDPGLTSLLSGNEGGDLILLPTLKGRLTTGSVRTIPAHNIRAGIGYLLMKMANYEYRSVQSTDTKVYEAPVKPGDSLDKIAKAQGSTVETLKKLNSTAIALYPGQVLKYQKASVQRVITNWRHISTVLIAQRYNGGGDPAYAKKLDYALSLVRKGKAALCAQ